MKRKFWEWLLKRSYKGLFKIDDDVDAIAHVAVAGEIRHVPVTYNFDKSRYETLDGENYWNNQAQGDNEYRVGPVPSVWASSESTELGSHVQADVAEALDLGKEKALFTDASVRHVEVEVDGPVPDDVDPDQAVADGGYQTQEWDGRIDIHDPGQLEDVLVPIGDDDPESDGRVISMEKYYQTYPSRVAPEEMKAQEERGRLAEMDRDHQEFALKMMLIAAAIIGVVVLGPPIIKALFGGGGGGILPG